MSINGEITAVRISRRSSLSNSKEELAEYDVERVEDEEKRSNRPPSGRHQQRPKSGRPSKNMETGRASEQMLRADSDQIDLEKLLHSMLDINDNKKNGKSKERPFSAHQHSSGVNGRDSVASNDSFGRTKHHIRPFSAHVQSQQKSNYSFSNDKVKEIDRENQRLLKELMRNQGKTGYAQQQPVFFKKAEPLKVQSSATLNRLRYQQQIERENLAFLRRLEKVKPTKELSRDHLLREHCKQEHLANNVSKGKRRPGMSRKSSSLNDLRNIDSESVASSRISAPNRTRTRSSKRPITAKSGVSSKRVVDSRPVWESGW